MYRASASGNRVFMSHEKLGFHTLLPVRPASTSPCQQSIGVNCEPVASDTSRVTVQDWRAAALVYLLVRGEQCPLHFYAVWPLLARVHFRAVPFIFTSPAF